MSETEMFRQVVDDTTVTNPQPTISTHKTNEALEWDIQRYYEAMGFDFEQDENEY